MMRTMILIASGVTLMTAATPAADAQQARNSPDQIVCAITNTCAQAGPGADQQIRVGNEKAFSLAKPAGRGAAAATPAATPPTPTRMRTPTRRVAAATARARPAVRSGAGLDMLVTFPSGSAQMTPQARAEARAFATAMQSTQLSGMKFAIEGHTDAVGKREYNLDLSQRRAQSVVDYLVGQGIDATRLEAHGYGFDKPKGGLRPKASGNRRVEFVRRA